MSGVVSIGGNAAAPAARVATARPLEGERLALGAVAVGIALLPLLVPAGPANVAPVDLLLLVAMGACLLWAGMSGHRFQFPYAIPVTLILVGGAIGALAGPVPEAGIVALSQELVLLAWCWTVVNVASSARRLRVLLATWAYSSIVWALLLFAGLVTGTAALTGHVENQGTRSLLTFDDPNYAANYFFISIMIIWATGYPRNRAGRVLSCLLLLSAMVTTGSNSGIVALIIGVTVAGLATLYARRGPVTAITALALLAVGGYFVASNVSITSIQQQAKQSQFAFLQQGIGRSEDSVSQRSTLVQESVRLYQGGSPLGEGPVSTKTRLKANMAPLQKEEHNDYFAGLIERGVLGLLGVVLLMCGAVLRAGSLVTGRLTEGFAAVAARPHALLGAVAGTAVAASVYELLHVRHLWTLFALVAALYVWGIRWSASGDS